jgi:hypothetical protein
MNAQRKEFQGRVAEHMKNMQAGAGDRDMNEGKGEHSSPVIGESKISHHEDGSHSVEHHDGEKSHHPSAGHMGVHMAAKHDGGEHGHIHVHGGGAATHHVGADGEVQGPHEHESAEAGLNHLDGAIGDGAGMSAESEPGTMDGQGEGGDSSFA